MPNPTPTDAQIVAVRKIAGLADRVLAEAKINALNDAEWVAAVALLDKWTADDLDSDATRLTGKVADDPSDERKVIRRALRTILGLSPFSDEDLGPSPGYSGAVATQPVW
jgi:hypothetical protein